jgi:hypothetical protein
MEVKGMIARFLLFFGLGILLGLPVGAAPPAAPASGPITNTLLDTVTVVSSDTVNPGTIAVERVTCPAGMTATGGGVDVKDKLKMEVTSSAPTFSGTQHRLLSQSDGTNRAPVGWQATVLNRSTKAKSFAVGVICATLSGVSTIVGSNEASVGGFASKRVKCPSGTVAVGGGTDLENVKTMMVTSSAPTFAGASYRLGQQPDGIHPAPNGWQASARNESTTTKGFKVAAICAPLIGVKTHVVSDAVVPGNYNRERAMCPTGYVTLGGGIDVTQLSRMTVSSSAPTYPGFPFFLLDQPDGINPSANGWDASAINKDLFLNSIKNGVICGNPVSRAFLPFGLREAE